MLVLVCCIFLFHNKSAQGTQLKYMGTIQEPYQQLSYHLELNASLSPNTLHNKSKNCIPNYVLISTKMSFLAS